MQSIRMNFLMFKMIYIITLLLLGSIVNSKDILKLPTNFKPISYRLNVTTHLEYQFMFEGVVDIQMTCIEATDTIVLHSNNLDIDTKSVVVANGGENVVPVGSVAFDPKKELMYVKSTKNFKPGDKYVLTIPFRGNLTDELGYYRNSYVDKENNQTRWFAVTQFEPAFARSAFPCFDEPQFKAKFKIILGHKKGLTSVSNMRMINESNSPLIPDYVFREFEESVPMSTYLVAYIVMSDFIYIESDSREGEVKFRIIARKDATNLTELAKKIGPLVLKYYEEYFDEKFPLPKQDMVAIPDFHAGAMENWGLVIYGENILLNNLDEDSIEKIESIAEVIAHELAHQWFGNLVTMKWWSDIWLNEGFATYLGIRGVDFLYPEWNSFQVETLINFLAILREDSLQSSHPLSVADRNSNEIQEIFDSISYKKGASLLHMMNMFLGENTFKQSIRNYIKKYKFSNADQNDLWSSFTEEAHRQGTLDKNLTVKLIMDTWTLKAGYPILKVVRNYSAETVTLSQERFLRSKSGDIDNDTCWWIPLTMTTSTKANFNQTIPKSWLNCENNNITIPLAKDNEWVIYNLQMAGLFRILYDTRNWMGIISTLNDPNGYKTIHTLNRVQLIDDSFTFSHNGDLDYGITFQLLNYLKHENEYAPWMTALDSLHFITEIMKRTPNQGVFQNFMRRLLLPVYSRFQNMTSKYNSFEETRFKNLVTTEACRHGIKDCTEQALKLFRKWMKTADPDKNNILPRELKPVIYCQAIKYGGVDEWDFLWERYQRSNVDSEKEELISTLGCSSDTWLLNRYLNWSLDDSIFRTKDTISVFYSVAKRDIGFYVAKDFLYRRWVDISKYFKSLGNIPRKYISIIGFEMKTIQELYEMESFMNKSENNLGGVVQIVGDMNNKPPVFEYIRVNIEGMLEFYHKIVNHIV